MLVLIALLALSLAWLSRERNNIQERRAMLKGILDRGGTLARELGGITPRHQPSRIRIWLGDEAVPLIGVSSDTSDAEMHEIQRMFPEAYLSRKDAQGGLFFDGLASPR
jgi:hypothetical protein